MDVLDDTKFTAVLNLVLVHVSDEHQNKYKYSCSIAMRSFMTWQYFYSRTPTRVLSPYTAVDLNLVTKFRSTKFSIDRVFGTEYSSMVQLYPICSGQIRIRGYRSTAVHVHVLVDLDSNPAG